MANLTLQTSGSSASNLIEYTFSTLDFGTAAANRFLIITLALRKQDAADDITGTTVTIGGVSATKVAMSHVINEKETTAIYIANVPTGTTGDLVVSIGTFLDCMGYGLWRTVGISATPTDTDNNRSDDPAVSLDVLAGGIIVGVVFNMAGTTVSWTGLTEGYDATIETNNTHSGASLDSATQQTVSITADFAAPSANASAGSFASFLALATFRSEMIVM